MCSTLPRTSSYQVLVFPAFPGLAFTCMYCVPTVSQVLFEEQGGKHIREGKASGLINMTLQTSAHKQEAEETPKTETVRRAIQN